MADPEIKDQMFKEEQKIKISLDNRELKETKEQFKEVWIAKLQADHKTQEKLKTIQAPNQQAAQQMVLVEQTKVLDKIYIEYGLKLTHLQMAYDKYDLQADADI